MPDFAEARPYLAVVLGLVGICGVIIWGIRARQRERTRDDVLARVRETLGAIVARGATTGAHEGTPYEYVYDEGSDDFPPTLEVSIWASSSLTFSLRRPGIDQLTQLFGDVREIRAADAAFEQICDIESEDAELATAVLRSAAGKQAVERILRSGFTSIRYDGVRLAAQWSPFARVEDLEASLITGTVAHLATLATVLPPQAGPTGRGVRTGPPTESRPGR